MIALLIALTMASQSLQKLPSLGHRVALTFDACETEKKSGFDWKIYEFLKDSQIPATIFLGGRWVESHPHETQLLCKLPNVELAQHSYIHPHLPKLSLIDVRNDLTRAQDSIRLATRRTPRFFRPPYGEVNSKIALIADELGLKTVLWSVVSGDPDPRCSARTMVASISQQVHDGSIIIMHINGRGWHTAEALPPLVQMLKKKAFKFVTLSQGSTN